MFDAAHFVQEIQGWGRALGFAQVGVAGVDLSSAEAPLLEWLRAGFAGEMHFMARHGLRRARPAELVPGTLSVVTARMDYLPSSAAERWREQEWQTLAQPLQAGVSVYARGRDYHKVLRTRLAQLAARMQAALAARAEDDAPPIALQARAFTDSAPVLEVELAQRSGLGWRGKHTLLLERSAGSMFFLGEIYLNLALPPTAPTAAHCGQCRACIDICPSQAIVAPYQLDARRCISYLTIEHPGPIAPELRPLLGNRIYGCDDCQLICPWNKYAQRSPLPDFEPRAGLAAPDLLTLWGWSAAEFERQTEGTPIRRIGFERWQRNLAVALGNALRARLPAADAARVRAALQLHVASDSALVREHVAWALEQTPP